MRSSSVYARHCLISSMYTFQLRRPLVCVIATALYTLHILHSAWRPIIVHRHEVMAVVLTGIDVCF